MNKMIPVFSFLLISLLHSCGNDSNPGNPVITATADTVIIGTQVWKTKNLTNDHYRNGDSIPEVKDSAIWATLKTGAWCYYNNNPAMDSVYGKLYNWYAVNDARGLAPAGWHVASNTERSTLIVYLGGGSFAGGKLKEAGTAHWNSPNTGATNESAFTALGAGYRGSNGSFFGINADGIFWSSTELVSTTAYANYLKYNNGIVLTHGDYKEYGFSVRCLKD